MASSFLLLQLVLLPPNPAATAFPEIIEFAPSFVPSKLCLENQSLWGLAWERPKPVHRTHPANPSQRQLPRDLTWFDFIFCSSVGGVPLSVPIYKRGVIWSGVSYLFMRFYYHKNQIATFKTKKKVFVKGGGGGRGRGEPTNWSQRKGATSLSKDNIKLISLWSQELM